MTKGTLQELLKTLELDELVKITDGSYMLDFYEHSQAPFSIFYKDLTTFIFQTSNSTTDQDYLKIVGAYTTPAERIIKTLMTLKAHPALKGDSNIERELNYCLNKISERNIFEMDA